MELISRLYSNRRMKENRDIDVSSNPGLLFIDEDMLSKVDAFLRDFCVLDTDLEFSAFVKNITSIFNDLGIGRNGRIVLSNMKSLSASGICSFNYGVNGVGSKIREVLEYYSSGEHFLDSEPYSIYPGVKVSNGKESICYSVGTVPQIRQYSIKINKDSILSREYS